MSGNHQTIALLVPLLGLCGLPWLALGLFVTYALGVGLSMFRWGSGIVPPLAGVWVFYLVVLLVGLYVGSGNLPEMWA